MRHEKKYAKGRKVKWKINKSKKRERDKTYLNIEKGFLEKALTINIQTGILFL